MPDPLQSTFTISVPPLPAEGETNDLASVPRQTYTFRIPTIKFDIEVGYKAAEIRNRAYPSGVGTLGGLDLQAVNFARYCAYLELYLVRSTTLWPYGFDTDDMAQVDFSKPPLVDFEKFPVTHTDDVFTLGQTFETEVSRFRRGGD
jgi:hypothetical protein